MTSQPGSSQSAAEACAVEMTGHVATLTAALRMIAQGYVFQGSQCIALDAEHMQTVAKTALSGKALR